VILSDLAEYSVTRSTRCLSATAELLVLLRDYNVINADLFAGCNVGEHFRMLRKSKLILSAMDVSY